MTQNLAINSDDKKLITTAKRSIIGLVVGIGVISSLLGSFYVNEEYERSVITNLGEVKRVEGPGLHWKIPFIEDVHTADTKINQIDYSGITIATRDGQSITLDLSINHKISDDSDVIVRLYEQFGNRFEYSHTLLNKLAQDRVKSVIGQYAIEDFMPNRNQARQKSLTSIVDSVRSYGIDIVDIQFSNFVFSPSFSRNLNDVAKARADAATAQQEARRNEYQANASIETARGESESKKLNSEAQAYDVSVNAKAEAEKISQISIAQAEAIRREGEARIEVMEKQALVLKNAEGLIEFTRMEALKNWDGSVPQFMTNAGGGAGNSGSIFPFMNLKDFESNKK